MTRTFDTSPSHAPSHTLWTSTELAKILHVDIADKWFATGVSIDTRTLNVGDIFIAIKGDHGDGHDHVKVALEKGAVAALVHQDVDGVDQKKLVRVDNTFTALQDLGGAARARCAAKIIGITGSVGKSGTKEMCGAALSAFGQTHWSTKSYNNHWGVPLSLSRMHAGSDYAVFEMGMNHHKEIEPLSRMVKPDIAIITTIAPVHIENFPDGIDGIAYAKSEIFAGINTNGIAIVHGDVDQIPILKAEAARHGIARVYTFGDHEGNDAVMLETLVARNGVRAHARIIDEDVTFTLRDGGAHHARNALAVLLALKLTGLDIQKAAKTLGEIEPMAGRGKRALIDSGDPDNPITLIDESYNASPIAMKAAFRVLALIDPGRGGRRIAVLGDMLELGNDSPRLHADLALPIKAANVDLVYTCGTLMKNLHDALPNDNRKVHRSTSRELAEIVPDVLVPGDVVMVKGSLGSKMNVIVEALRHLPQSKQRKGQ
jgi:UDP-N-acetylmuramoyl-tripeptide--D-alanyl-D-alanine ligase